MPGLLEITAALLAVGGAVQLAEGWRRHHLCLRFERELRRAELVDPSWARR